MTTKSLGDREVVDNFCGLSEVTSVSDFQKRSPKPKPYHLYSPVPVPRGTSHKTKPSTQLIIISSRIKSCAQLITSSESLHRECPRQNSHTRASPGRDSEHNFLNVMLIEKQIFAPFLAPPLFPASCAGPRPRNWKLTGLVPQRFKGPSTASTLLPAENDSLRASRPPHCPTGTVINS